MRRRWVRTAVLAGLVLVALGSAGLLGLGIVRPSWACRGGAAVGVSNGRLEIAWSSGTVRRASIAWDLQGPEGSASILVGPARWWRPSASSDSIGTSPSAAGAPLFTLTVVYLPLWPLVVVAGGAAAGLWWRWRHVVEPGHCAACGYDLRGLAPGRCPECGAASASVMTRILWAVTGVAARLPRRLATAE